MLRLSPTNQFRKDYKQAKKRGLDLSLLEAVIDVLLAEQTLDDKHHDHALVGSYAGFRECHIQPDWLLIYRIERDRLVLITARTGSHSDLIRK